MGIRNFEDYIWSLKCEIETFMSALIEKLNITFMAELPHDLSAENFLQCRFYICQEIVTMRIRWWGQKQFNGDSIKMFAIKICTLKTDQIVLYSFSNCIKQAKKLVQS